MWAHESDSVNELKTQIWLFSPGMASLFVISCLFVEKLQKHIPLLNKPLEAGLFGKCIYTLQLKFSLEMYPLPVHFFR